MKKYLVLSLALGLSSVAFAQKDELKGIKKIFSKKAPTQADYKQAQSLIDEAHPYIGNLEPSEQAEFYYYKGNFEILKAIEANSTDSFALAVESFNSMIQAESSAKRKTYTEKFKNELYPEIKPKVVQKAINYINNKKYREATVIFKAIYDLDKDPLYLYNAASTAVNAPDYNTALEYYQTLLDLNYTGETVYYTAINKATNTVENFGQNKALMDKLVKEGDYANPKREVEKNKRPEILKNMVLIYMQVNQKSRAEQLLADARKASPEDMDLMLIEANFHLQNGNKDKFEAILKQALAKDPNNADLYFNLAVTAGESGNTDSAKEYYLKALAINPKYVDAHINLGMLQLTEEEKIIEQMNAITGYTAADNKKYSELKAKRENLLKSAIPHLERALAIEPSNQFALSNLASIYSALDMPEKAEQYKAKLKN